MRTIPLFALCLVLISCGGHGDGDTTPPDSPPSSGPKVKIYSELSNPLMLSVPLENGRTATLFGVKRVDGSYAAARGMFFEGGSSPVMSIQLEPDLLKPFVEQRGLPTMVSLGDAGVLRFIWIAASGRDPERLNVYLHTPRGLTFSATPSMDADTTAAFKELFACYQRPVGDAWCAPVPTSDIQTGSHLDVTLSSGARAESKAAVLAMMSPMSVPGGKAHPVPLEEVAPGQYRTLLVDSPLAVPSERLSPVCAGVSTAFARQCTVLSPLSTMMMDRGCAALATSSSMFLSPSEIEPTQTACQRVFTDAKALCTSKAIGIDGGASCSVGLEEVRHFDPLGSTLKIIANKGGRAAEAEAVGPSTPTSVQLGLEMPPPRYTEYERTLVADQALANSYCVDDSKEELDLRVAFPADGGEPLVHVFRIWASSYVYFDKRAGCGDNTYRVRRADLTSWPVAFTSTNAWTIPAPSTPSFINFVDRFWDSHVEVPGGERQQHLQVRTEQDSVTLDRKVWGHYDVAEPGFYYRPRPDYLLDTLP